MKIVNRIFILFLLVCFLGIHSCAVENFDEEEALISSAARQKVMPIFLQHDLSAYNIKPNWDAFFVFEGKESVEVNFSIDNKMRIPLSPTKHIRGRERLLLTLHNNTIIETIIEYRPNDNFIGDIKKINAGNFFTMKFNGEISFRKPLETKRVVWYLQNGKIVKKAVHDYSAKKPEGKHKDGNQTEGAWECNVSTDCAGDGNEVWACVVTADCYYNQYGGWANNPDEPPPTYDDPVPPYEDPIFDWPWDGYGVEYPTQDPPVEQDRTPCEQISALGADHKIQRIMKNLQYAAKNYNNETAHVIVKDPNPSINIATPNQYSSEPFDGFKGEVGAPEVTYKFHVNTIKGVLHNHYKNLLSVPSATDLQDLWTLMKNPAIPDDFFYGLTTQDTNYMLLIEDRAAFVEFGNKNFSTPNDFAKFERKLKDDYGISEDNYSSANEVGFLKMLREKNAGVSTFTSKDNFNSYKKLNYQNNQVQPSNCN